MKEANACHDIRDMLFQKGYDIPICADMHFQPKVAIKTVRPNPNPNPSPSPNPNPNQVGAPSRPHGHTLQPCNPLQA